MLSKDGRVSNAKKSEANRIERGFEAMRAEFPEAEPSAWAMLESVIEDDDWPYELPPDAIEVQLFGQPDDHLRLVTLLADRLGERGDQDCAAVCSSRDEPWPRRRDAFRFLLDRCERRRIPLYVVDPDALAVEARSSDGSAGTDDQPAAERARHARQWDDHTLAQQRAEALDDIIAHVGKSERSLFLRPAPDEQISRRLSQLNWDVELSDEIVSAAEARPDPEAWTALLMTLPPACRMLALGSLDDDEIDSRKLIDPQLLLKRAWRRLTPSAARDARVTATLRGRQAVNGHYGPLLIKRGVHPDPKLDPRTCNRLRVAGWLTNTIDHQGREALWMQRPVRTFVRDQETDTGLVMRVHRFLAERDIERQSLSERLETHHHAVCSGDVKRAIDTAVHYTGHLRQLAIRLSEDGAYGEAMRVYRFILEHDGTDAYAWEYLAYNGALAGHDPTVVLGAFERACELDPTNPLYRGRWLGYRVQLGQDIEADFDQWMRRLAPEGRLDFDKVSYFAEAVLNGVERGLRDGPRPSSTTRVAQRITGRWRSEMLRVPRLRRFSTSGYWAG